MEVGGVVSVDGMASVSPAISEYSCTFPNVGEQVHRSLPHGGINRAARVAATSPVVQAPRPLHCPAAEHQGATGDTVLRHVMGGSAVEPGRAAVVGKDLRVGISRRGQVYQPRRPEPIVGVDVPLVAEGAGTCIERSRLTRRQAGHPGVAPDPQLAALRRRL